MKIILKPKLKEAIFKIKRANVSERCEKIVFL